MRRRQHKRRLSLISDILIFLLLTPIILVFLNLIDPTKLKGEVRGDEILLLTQEDSNNINVLNRVDSKISYINDNYGIDINYGSQTEYIAQAVSASTIENLNIVDNNIQKLTEALKKYPASLFNIFKDTKKYKLTIVLLDKFNNSNIALASKNSKNEYKIFLSNDVRFERAFHHEMFHIIEYYISNLLNSNNIFPYWNNINPEKFTYNSDIEKLTKEYVFEEGLEVSDCYFVTKYSKTSEKEDRAEVFAEIMTYNMKPSYLDENGSIKIKAQYICSILDDNLKTSSNLYLYWDRFLIK